MGFEISFTGIKDNATWNLAAGIVRGTDEGKVVKISAAETVSLCSAEDKFLGVLVTIENGNGYGVVEQKGYHKVSYSGSAPTVGIDRELVANGSGGVKTPASAGTGKYYHIVSVDTENSELVLYLG